VTTLQRISAVPSVHNTLSFIFFDKTSFPPYTPAGKRKRSPKKEKESIAHQRKKERKNGNPQKEVKKEVKEEIKRNKSLPVADHSEYAS